MRFCATALRQHVTNTAQMIVVILIVYLDAGRSEVVYQNFPSSEKATDETNDSQSTLLEDKTWFTCQSTIDSV